MMRRFNTAAMSDFKTWVDSSSARDEDGLSVHVERLYSPDWTEAVPHTHDIPAYLLNPATSYELGHVVCQAMHNEDRAILMEDEGLMCWLIVKFRQAIFYKKGVFYAGDRHRYLFPDSRSPRNNLRGRHLVRTRVMMVNEHGGLAKRLLCMPPSSFTKLEDEYSSRADACFAFLRSDNFFAAATMMYSQQDDDGQAMIRPGSNMSFKRLVSVGAQLSAAYDLGSMKSSDIINILPDEFKSFKNYAKTS